MDAISSGDESDTAPMYKDMLEDILDSSYYHPIVNRREARYNIRYCIKLCRSDQIIRRHQETLAKI